MSSIEKDLSSLQSLQSPASMTTSTSGADENLNQHT